MTMDILTLGLDFAEHARFNRLVPELSWSFASDQPQFYHVGPVTNEDSSWCFHFVLATALRLQALIPNAGQ